jgi:hypothetical protein
MTSEDGDETEDRCFLRVPEKRKILKRCKTDFISAATCDRVSLNTVDILATDWMFLPAIAGKELCVEFGKYGRNGDELLQH